MQVAQTILQQLGGNRFLAMTGARDLVSDAARQRGALTMRLGRNERGVSHIRVTLTEADLYDVEALHVGRGARALVVAPVAQEAGIHAEELRATFERLTGLATSL